MLKETQGGKTEETGRSRKRVEGVKKRETVRKLRQQKKKKFLIDSYGTHTQTHIPTYVCTQI